MNTTLVSAITKESGEGTLRRIADYAVTIVDLEDGRRPSSGILISLGSHLFVANAAHVMPRNPGRRLQLLTRTPKSDHEGFPSFVNWGKVKNERPDVGFLELNPSVALNY